ncbi:MAG: signal recognition particle-docking protein FtsY [Burkholderiaceae bacterium]
MFGFLRRKRPPEGGAAPSPAPAPVPEAAAPATAPAGGPGSALYPGEVLAGPVEATTETAPPAAVQAPALEAPLPTVVPPAFDAGARATAVEPAPERRSWMKRLREGLSKTRGNLAGLFSGARVDDALFEELESALLASDAGVATTDWLMRELQQRVRRDRLADGEQVRQALRALAVELLEPLEKPMDIDRAEPLVLMIAGVNGAGKTTSIGKLAHHLRREGKSILLAAGDTFRAAAREQLAEWGSRNDVEVIAQQGGDPAAVAFDAVSAGRARRTGVVMIDTAGRLPTQLHLMEELKKIRRVVAKAMDGAPHETLLVLDGNTGQNMLAQVKAFDDAIGLSGLIVTKLDGTAKGGAIAALAHTRRERPIPVYFVGVGEGIEDLQAFSAEEFASALFD